MVNIVISPQKFPGSCGFHFRLLTETVSSLTI
jgi:hypothetical protein